MENSVKPILSCAGRTTESIDSALLQQLLQSYSPYLIGIHVRAQQLAEILASIANGEYGDKSLDMFRDTITEEFLFIQLMEASRLARTTPAGMCEDAYDPDNH